MKKEKKINEKKTIKGEKAGAVRSLYMWEEAHSQPLTAPDCSLLLRLIVCDSVSPSGFNSNLLRYPSADASFAAAAGGDTLARV